MPAPRSLVLGSAGFLGLNLVDALLAAGHAPLCAHRARTNTIPLRRRNVARAVVDLDVPDTLTAAMAGQQLVYHLAGHYPRDARTPEATRLRAVAELERVLDAAAAAHVRRLVYVSSTATVAPRADGRPATEADVYPVMPRLGAYHDAKWAMEDRALREDRLEVVVVCPGACLGPWDLRVGTSALVIATANGLNPPHPDGLVNLVDVRDVAKVLVALGAHPHPPRRLLVAAHDVSLHGFLGDLAAHFGAPTPRPPLAPADAIALADSEEARVAGTAERALIAREIVDLILHGTAIDGGRAATLLPGGYTPLAETLAELEHFARRMRMIPDSIPSKASDPCPSPFPP